MFIPGCLAIPEKVAFSCTRCESVLCGECSRSGSNCFMCQAGPKSVRRNVWAEAYIEMLRTLEM